MENTGEQVGTDLNLVCLVGRVAIDPEHRKFEDGSHLVRLLITVRTEVVTVRSEKPRLRVDTIPVTLWDPQPDHLALQPDDRVWITGQVQRRFRDCPEGRHSTYEVVAKEIKLRNRTETSAEEAAVQEDLVSV